MTLALTVGCYSSYELDTAPVSGVVTLDGKPLTQGYVTVTPHAGRMARGAIGPDGTFTLTTYRKGDGAQLGTHALVVTPRPIDEGGPMIEGPQPPSWYGVSSTSGLEVTVVPGQNEVNLSLSSKKSE